MFNDCMRHLRRGLTAMNFGAITGYQLAEAHSKNEIYENRNAPSAM